MTHDEIIQAMLSKKRGQYVNLKKVKDLGSGCKKITSMVIRLGVDYANMKVNEDRKDSIGTLPWGEWVEGLEGYVIRHTDKNGETHYYLRVASSYSNTTKSIFTIDGVEVSKEEVELKVPQSKLKSSSSDVYNIKFENILELN